MTLYGIDPAADSFTVGTYPHAGFKPVTFEATPDGVAAFVATLPQSALGATDLGPTDLGPTDLGPTDLSTAEVVVAVENTGVYSEILCYELHRAGVPLVLVDPGAVARAFKGTPKTDPADSRKIAEYALRHLDRLVPWRPHADIVEQVRVLLSTREQLVGQRTAAKNARTSLRRKAVQTPGANAALDAVVAHLATQIKALEAELRRLIGSQPTLAVGVSLLVAIPGVGVLLAAQMLVLTSGFTRVLEYRQAAQWLGIAPNAHQSGTSVRKKARSRGFGHGAVRKLLHLGARSVCIHDARRSLYYAEKVASGKERMVVLNNLSNWLLRVMCAVLREGQPYRPGYVSVSPALLTSHRQSG